MEVGVSSKGPCEANTWQGLGWQPGGGGVGGAGEGQSKPYLGELGVWGAVKGSNGIHLGLLPSQKG